MEKRSNIKRYSFLKVDIEYYFLFILTLILSIIGLIMISSSSISVGERYFNDPYWFIRRQVIWWTISFVFFILASKINYHYYKRFSNIIILLSIGLLALVFIPGFGIEINGYTRWLNLWFFSVQPSEFVKIALVILFSNELDKKYKDNKYIKRIIFPSFFALCIVAILIFLEPDLGTMVVIGLVVFVVLFVGGVKFKHLFSLGFIGLVVTVGYLFLEDYRRERLFAFIDRIVALIHGSGEIGEVNFQISQSLIALGSGNLTGVGLGNSVQKYSYLPEAHTDFIFAIIGEELGLVGTILIVILFILFMFFGIRVCIKTRDYFGRIMAAGLTSIIIVQAIINISVVIGLLPVTGLTLPFISFGGSSLLMSMIAVGILLNISRHNTLPERTQNNLEN
ncbi:MAG: cell division protein FtsW [Actinobacteria bacterium RBG_13_35_12]|jgi:cell division protein FtsW|nr:MAG: cell division protein FtsW [Actinobacteria bacterium RBG_13_35_12]